MKIKAALRSEADKLLQQWDDGHRSDVITVKELVVILRNIAKKIEG